MSNTATKTDQTAAPVVQGVVMPLSRDMCDWVQSPFVGDYWETSCGNAFPLNDGTPEDNKMQYCPYCGGPLKQHPAGCEE